MTGVVRVHKVGGPEVLRFEDIEVGPPGPGQARIRQTAVGLNYIDVYFRSGLYPAPSLPFIAGQEGAGVVEVVGDGVSEFRVGQRVAYAGPLGAYAERRLIPAYRLVVVPDGITDEQAAAMMLKGMTAQYLLRRTYPVQRGLTQAMRDAGTNTDDIDRIQAWSGQSARLAMAKPAGEVVRELWSGAQALLRS